MWRSRDWVYWIWEWNRQCQQTKWTSVFSNSLTPNSMDYLISKCGKNTTLVDASAILSKLTSYKLTLAQGVHIDSWWHYTHSLWLRVSTLSHGDTTLTHSGSGCPHYLMVTLHSLTLAQGVHIDSWWHYTHSLWLRVSTLSHGDTTLTHSGSGCPSSVLQTARGGGGAPGWSLGCRSD